jgi:hypothetical protein
MMRRLLFLSAILLSFSAARAQVYTYNFGTGADSIVSTGTAVVVTNATNPNLVPTPADGGTARARVGTGGGRIATRNYANFGTGSSMRIQAPTSTSVNKFSVYNIGGASNTMGLKVTFSIGDSLNTADTVVNNGTFYFFAGNGSSFSDNSGFTGSHIFAGLRLVLGSTSAALTVRVGSSWVAAPIPISVPYATSMSVILYMNNNSTSVSYTDINNVSRTLPAGSIDLFAYNPIFSSYDYQGNLLKGALAANTAINSFMFYGESSVGNEANLFLDNIVYTNNIVANTLPLKLSFFDALPDNNNIRLFWKTEVETSVKDYTVEHSTDGINFRAAGKVTSLKTNGSSYTFTHTQPAAKNFYRLKIANEDGSAEYSQVIMVSAQTPNTIRAWHNDHTLHIAQHEDATLSVYDLGGRRVLHTEVKRSEYAVDLSGLAPGSYIAHLVSGRDAAVVRFVR